MSETITQRELEELAQAAVARGARVLAPMQVKPDVILYHDLASGASMYLEGWFRPANSIKEMVLPRHEKLYGYKLQGKRIELVEDNVPPGEQIVLVPRPCDAAAVATLDHVFNWDYSDEHYNRRRQATTVVTLACQGHDEHCFCTSVGLGPDVPKGSDAMLFDLGDGVFEVLAFTDKGRRLFDGKTRTAETVASVGPGPEKWLHPAAIEQFFELGFENSRWESLARRCLGCGACAFACPTCHCFDVVDEREHGGGYRARNWDACQFGMFTLHASGHNPRNNQAQRQRQRIYHKFHIYPEKFGEILCTGCGNCTRNCPVELGLQPVLAMIQETLAKQATEGA